MQIKQPVIVNKLSRGEITITVKLGKRLRVRIWLAFILIRLAGWLINHEVNIEEG